MQTNFTNNRMLAISLNSREIVFFIFRGPSLPTQISQFDGAVAAHTYSNQWFGSKKTVSPKMGDAIFDLFVQYNKVDNRFSQFSRCCLFALNSKKVFCSDNQMTLNRNRITIVIFGPLNRTNEKPHNAVEIVEIFEWNIWKFIEPFELDGSMNRYVIHVIYVCRLLSPPEVSSFFSYILKPN